MFEAVIWAITNIHNVVMTASAVVEPHYYSAVDSDACNWIGSLDRSLLSSCKTLAIKH